MRTLKPSATVVAAFAVIYLVWGSTYLAIRIGLETLPPFLLAGVRFSLAGAVLYLWLRVRGLPRPCDTEWWAAAAVGVLMLVGGVGGVTWAEQRVDSGIAALLVATVPLWVALLDRVAGRSEIRGRAAAGLALGLAGVALLVAPELGGLHLVDPVGALAVLASAGSWSLGTVLSRGGRLPRSPAMTVAVQMLVAGVVLLFLAGASGEWRAGFAPAAVSARSLVALGWLTFAGSIATLCAYVWLLRQVPAPAVASYAFVNPVVAVLLGWWILAEHVGPRVAVAGGLIVVAVVLVQSSRWAPPAAAEPPPEVLPRRFRLRATDSLLRPPLPALASRWQPVSQREGMQPGSCTVVSGRSLISDGGGCHDECG